MQRIKRMIPHNCEIIVSSCQHLGSHFCHEDGVRSMVEYVRENDDTFIILLGDIIEAITVDDRRYDPLSTKKPIPILQMLEAVEIFRPIADKIIVALIGNHEWKQHRFGNLVQDIFCRELKVPYGTEEARVVFIDESLNQLFKIYVAHGNRLFKSAAKDHLQKIANRKAALKLYLSEMMGDVSAMFCGHAHWLAVVPPTKRLYIIDGADGVKERYLHGHVGSGAEFIPEDQRWYGCAGSFYKRFVDGQHHYGSYNPVEIGWLKMIVEDGQLVDVREVII